MKNLLTLIILILMSELIYSQNKTFIDHPYLETIAEVDTMVIPDRIYISILLSEDDKKDKESVEEMERRMRSSLESIGINMDEQLKLRNLSSDYARYFLRGQEVSKSKSFELLVYDGTTAGQVILELEEVDISNVQISKTEFVKIENLKLELMSKAVEKAKRQAAALTKPLSQEIGQALHVVNINTEIINHLSARTSGIEYVLYEVPKQKKQEVFEIEFKKIKVVSKVKVVFELN